MVTKKSGRPVKLPPPPTKENRTRVNANIPVELHKALKIRAANEGTTIGQLIEDWIASWAGRK